jgi:type IV pilus assembly protein PilV
MNTPQHRKPLAVPHRKQGGVALLEALVATVILAIGLLGAIGMQARAYAALNEAGLRAEATMCSEKLLAQMAVDQANAASYAYSGGNGSAKVAPWLLDTRTRIPNATITVGVTAVTATRTQVDIHIAWQRKAGKGSAVNNHDVTSYIATSK